MSDFVLRAGRWPLLLLLLAAALLAPAPAAAEPDGLRQARNHFEFGQYDRAVELLDQLHAQKQLAEEGDLLEAWRVHALAHYYLGHLEQARASFLQLLKINPDITLDPVLVPPGALAELEAARRENAVLLEPIRAQRRALEEARRREREEYESVVTIERHSFLLNFIPFGVPQIEQGRSGVGTTIAIGEAIALGATVLSFTQFKEVPRENAGKYLPRDYSAARNWRTANWVACGTAAAIYIVGIVDAALAFKDETTAIERRPRAPQPPGPRFTLAPDPNGVSAVVSGSF